MSPDESAQDEQVRGRQLAYRAVWLSSAVAIGVTVLLFGRKEEVVEAITEWKPYTQEQGGFTIEGPANWELRTAGSRGLGGSLTLKRTELVSIRAEADDVMLGPVIDMARAAGRSGPGPSIPALPQGPGGLSLPTAPSSAKTLVGQVHEFTKSKVAGAAAPDFEEPRPEETSLAGMEAAVSEFAYTQSGQFGKKIVMRGKRATIVGTAIGYTIVCQCPEASWETLKPSFDRVIKSFLVTKK